MALKKENYLTKSRFKLAIECPTKVRFSLEPSRYANQQLENPFLLALAQGGFQVGELAKLHYPNGRDCSTWNNEAAMLETSEWLRNGEKIIFEAALKSGFKFIRVDVLEVSDSEIRIIEVKSKAVIGSDDDQFLGKNRSIKSEWRSYLEDLAFQVHVAQEYFDGLGWGLPVKGYLFCPDKNKRSSVGGLHQQFVIRRDENGESFCQVKSGINLSDLGDSMMTLVDASQGISAILGDDSSYQRQGWNCTSFLEAIAWIEDKLTAHSRGVKIPFMPVGAHCAHCSFSTKNELKEDGKESGRRACFEHNLAWGQEEFIRPKVWDVWNLRSTKSLIAGGRWFMDELTEEDFNIDLVKPEEIPSQILLPQEQRQWIQISEAKGTYNSTYLDVEGLERKVSKFSWPLHFIDFETAAPAIPFYQGYAPYQGVSFQFSHHTLHKDGRLEHSGQYLGRGQGMDPTYEFVQALYSNLSNDDGTVFMYSPFENICLNSAHQLLRRQSPFTKDVNRELLTFLESLSKPTKKNKGHWVAGPRLMVDIADLVRNHFWHPTMAGSNSIKTVFPAVLNDSRELQLKYRQPVYGTEAMPSLNYQKGFSWIEFNAQGSVKDPYSLLPKLQSEALSDELQVIESLFVEDGIANGGAAMTAWSYMQFAEMSTRESLQLEEALKKYCELDTLAMAIIMEYFLLEIAKS